MNEPNTPVHIRLWHHDFWLLSISEFFLAMSVYMLLPTMPIWLASSQNLTNHETGLVMGVFALGLFALGAFVSFLIQRFRRNIICVWSIAAVASLLLLTYYLDSLRSQFIEFPLFMLIRFALGAAFGLSQMVLCSTLIIDTCESNQRTAANFAVAWFSRFALVIGPLIGIVVLRQTHFGIVLLAASGCAVVSLIAVMMVSFPFRTPEDDVHLFSLDRFLLPQGLPLFVSLLLITAAFGLVLSLTLSETFYAMMMLGFFVSLLCWRFVFRDAEMKSEVVSGLILIGAALLMMITRSEQPVVGYASPLFIGIGMGIIGSRFLLFFIKLSRHCQRGTSQSTYMLGWECGIALGVGLGLAFFTNNSRGALLTAFGLVVAALIVYQFLHNWFMRNKNR